MTTTRGFQMAVAAALAGVIGMFAAVPATAGIIPGGTGKSDCYAAIDVSGIDNGTPRVENNKKVLCTDGEACDSGVCGDGICNMQVAACINQPGLAGCTPPSGLEKLQVKGKLNIEVPQVLQGSACGAFLDVTVATKKGGKKPGKAKFTVLAKAPKGTKPRKDKDTYQLLCVPRTVECPPPTTTTTSTTTTTLITGPPPTLLPTGGLLDFQVAQSSAACGKVTSDTAGTTQIAALGCGGLNIGGGNAAAPPEGPTPDGSINRFGLRDCEGDICSVIATNQSIGTATTDCTNTGCPFGTPLPILGSPATCVLNTFASPASGTFNLATGATSDLSVNLSSNIFLTGLVYLVKVGGSDVGQPCPVCVNNLTDLVALAGSPTDLKTGVCNGGARAGQACTTQNSAGLTKDCLPGGGSNPANPTCDPTVANGSCKDAFNNVVGNLGGISVNLTPLATQTVAKTAADGLFCPSQANAGCFAAELLTQAASGAACRGIFANGLAFNDLRGSTPQSGVLGSVFCIPLTTSAIVNASANLPGPGEITLPGTMTYTPPAP